MRGQNTSLPASGFPEGLFDRSISVEVPAGQYRWNWRDAVLLKSYIDIYRTMPQYRERIVSYVKGEMIRLAPKAHGMHPNGVASAVGLAFLQEIGEQTAQTQEALERVKMQYERISRSVNEATSHRAGTVELWDDTLYMVGIFLMGCYQAGGDMAYLRRLATELLAHAEYLCDRGTGMWYHAWAETMYPTLDDCSKYGWNANPSHHNSEFWGRGNGWIAMTMADILSFLPSDDPDYKPIEAMFVRMMNTLARLQDGKTGLWYQLPAHPGEKGNFLESSCTAMFGYAAAKGARLGILPPKFAQIARKAYNGIVQHCIDAEDGSLGQICAGTCVGDKAYYYGREIVQGTETYATGAVLMLANEMENYK